MILRKNRWSENLSTANSTKQNSSVNLNGNSKRRGRSIRGISAPGFPIARIQKKNKDYISIMESSKGEM